MQIVDLSQDIYEGMQVYPGHLKTVQFVHVTHEETSPRFESDFSFQTSGLMLNDNGPTHVDSFSHFDPDPSAQTIEKMSLELFYGTAVCLDLSEFQPATDISAEDLDTVESESAIEVRPGDIVLFYTATWNRYGGNKRYLSDFPGLGESACDWIVQRGVKTFGVDSPTPDNPTSTTYPCHIMCRQQHITHYENLANLDKVVNKRFTFSGFPLKVQGAHGGPTRAVALID